MSFHPAHAALARLRRFARREEPPCWFSDNTKIEPTEILSFSRDPDAIPIETWSDEEEELDPRYPLNFLPIASDMRRRIANLPRRDRAEVALWELAVRAGQPG